MGRGGLATSGVLGLSGDGEISKHMRTRDTRCILKCLIILTLAFILIMLYTPVPIYLRKGALTVYIYTQTIDCSCGKDDVTALKLPCNETINDVPKFVHYIWYREPNHQLRFHEFISIISADKFIKPKKIFIWGNNEPGGRWWRELKYRLKSPIQMKYHKPPSSVAGKPLKVPEHKSDVTRLEVMRKYGGIYLDMDVVVLRSFDPLLKYEVTMGRELDIAWPTHICAGIIVAKPNSGFLQVWWRYFKKYFDDKDWAFHAVLLPGALAEKCRHLIHVEGKTLHRPNYLELKWIYNECCSFDWSKNYAMHLWYRYYNKDHNPEDIKQLNTTLGQVFRYVYYGTKEII